MLSLGTQILEADLLCLNSTTYRLCDLISICFRFLICKMGRLSTIADTW